ncbi:MAG: hypothetical protein NVSMB46_05160 [Candidatus Saccharimonadales bacterium]
MNKERDPDLQFPDEEAIEARVRNIMETSEDTTIKEPIAINSEDVPQVLSAPELHLSSKKSSSSHSISIRDDNEVPTNDLADQESTEEKHDATVQSVTDLPSAPQVYESPTIEPKVDNRPSKKITINHFSDQEQIEVPSVNDPKIEPTIEPLIPTDKLTSVITSSSSKPKAKRPSKKVKIKETDAEQIEKVADSPFSSSMEEVQKIEVQRIDKAEKVETKTPLAHLQPFRPTIPTKIMKNTEENDTNEESLPETLPLNDLVTSKAINEIVAKEGDEALEAEDAGLVPTFVAAKPKKPQAPIKNHGIKSHHFATKKRMTFIIFGALLVMLIVIGIVPAIRIRALNLLNVHGSEAVSVVDSSTNQPLKDVQVSVDGQVAITDATGKALVRNISLGNHQLLLTKKAYVSYSQSVDISWGTNDSAVIQLKPSGKQYQFSVVDYLSNKPLPKVLASSGTASALSDTKGDIKLTVDNQTKPFHVTLALSGYRSEQVLIDPADTSLHTIVMVVVQKAAYVSTKNSKYDVYTVDIDGKNEQVILAGSGNEKNDTKLIPSPSGMYAAVLSLRDKKRDANGSLMPTLTMLNLLTNETRSIAQSAQLQVVNWTDDKLVYTDASPDAASSSPTKQRLISYDPTVNKSTQLAAANYFNTIFVTQDKVFYSAASAYISSTDVGLYSIKPDGTAKQQLLNREVWNSYRVDFNHIALAVQQDWYEYTIGDNKVIKKDTAPKVLVNRLYSESHDLQYGVWADMKDTKGILALYDTNTQKEQVLVSQVGLQNPIRWLGNKNIIFRISSDQETADYIIAITGGGIHKIHDVGNITSIEKWHY